MMRLFRLAAAHIFTNIYKFSKLSSHSSALIDMQTLLLRNKKSTLVRAAESHSVTRRGHLRS